MTVTEENESQFYSLQVTAAVTAEKFGKELTDLTELGEATKEEENESERDMAIRDDFDISQEQSKIELEFDAGTRAWVKPAQPESSSPKQPEATALEEPSASETAVTEAKKDEKPKKETMLDRVRKTMAADREERHAEQEERKRQIEEELKKEEIAKKQETPSKKEEEEKKGASKGQDEAVEGKQEEKAGTTGPSPAKAPKGSTGQTATAKKKSSRPN